MSTTSLRSGSSRSSRYKMIAGVCGGLAEYFGLDPTVVRIAYVLVSILSAAFPGILAYIVLMFVMPAPGETPRDSVTRPRIFVTNDDGVFSEGIERLAAALAEVGDVVTVAPDQERSAAGHSLTLHSPLRAKLVGENRWSVDGTPTDCVNWGILHLMKDAPAAAALLGDQPGAEPGRRRDLLGHGLRRLRGDADRRALGRRSRRRSRRDSRSTRRRSSRRTSRGASSSTACRRERS